MRVRVEGLRFSYGSAPVLKGIDLDGVLPGRVTAVIGPNAAGKSTFFKCIAGLLRAEGRVLLDGILTTSYKRASDLARVVSYLPQEYPSSAAITVFEAVLLARQQSASWMVDDANLAHVWGVLSELRIDALALRYLNELSGGQRQLVAVAQALAREPRVLLLDEPTSSLDLQRQLELLSLVKAVAVARDVSVLIAVHDLNLAARHADHLIVLDGGTIYGAGPPAEVLSEAMLRHVYGVEARVSLDAEGIPTIAPIRSIHDPAYVPYTDLRTGAVSI